MQTHRHRSPRSHRLFHKAFTITELLVVIGMIAILMGILFPVIKKVRYAAYAADTKNEISQLSNACSAYYTTFHAYPGPFSNDDTSGGAKTYVGPGMGPTSLTQIYIGGTTISIPNAPWTVTGAENLVVGLMGGLRLAAPLTNPPTLAFAPAEVGLGPLSLNPANPSRTPSFFPTGSNYLLWCQTNSASQPVQNTGAFQNQSGSSTGFSGTAFTDNAGTSALDCPIPVFVDRYPLPGPLPILYMRARTGAKGIVWDNITGGTGGAYYQYDLRDIMPYTTTHIGLAPTDATGMANSHNLVGVMASAASNFPPNTSVLSNDKAPHPQQIQNAGPYFMNSSITPTDPTDPNGTGRPRSVDQFILISAGPDGVYGTSDDITSFGDVSN